MRMFCHRIGMVGIGLLVWVVCLFGLGGAVVVFCLVGWLLVPITMLWGIPYPATTPKPTGEGQEMDLAEPDTRLVCLARHR